MEVFLGGTCNNSKWRDELIPMIDIDYFNPVVENWTKECQEIEIQRREECDICLYVLTPKMEGYFSVAEVVEDSCRRPHKVVLCIMDADGPLAWKEDSHPWKSLLQVSKMVAENGCHVAWDLPQVAQIINEWGK